MPGNSTRANALALSQENRRCRSCQGQISRMALPRCLSCWRQLIAGGRSEEHTSELQSLAYLVCRLLLEKKKIVLFGVLRDVTVPCRRAPRLPLALVLM